MSELMDWSDTPEWREYARDVRRRLVPMIENSAITISIAPSDGQPDVKFAVELGFSVMLDKPIIVVVRPGTRVPEHLVRVADRIVEIDLDNDADESSRKRLAAAIAELGIGGT